MHGRSAADAGAEGCAAGGEGRAARHETEQGAVAVDVEAVFRVAGLGQDGQHPVQIVHRPPHLRQGQEAHQEREQPCIER